MDGHALRTLEREPANCLVIIAVSPIGAAGRCTLPGPGNTVLRERSTSAAVDERQRTRHKACRRLDLQNCHWGMADCRAVDPNKRNRERAGLIGESLYGGGMNLARAEPIVKDQSQWIPTARLSSRHCFFSSEGQFSTTVIGSGLVWPAGVIIRNFWPSGEGT